MMKSPRRALALLLLGSLLGCQREHDTDYRPGQAQRLRPDSLHVRAPIVLDTLTDLVSHQGGQPFQQIQAAGLDGSGGVVVLDSRLGLLSMLDGSGVLSHSIGREALNPTDLILDSGAVVVVDEGAGDVLRYEVVDDRVQFEGRLSIGIASTTGCVIANALILRGYSNGALLHWVDREGNAFHSAEEPASSPGANEAQAHSIGVTLSRGFVECLSGDIVVALAKNLPGVTAYSASGRLLWRSTIPGFHALAPIATDDGRIIYAGEGNSGWHHTILSVTAIQDVLLVQVAQEGLPGTGANATLLETVVLQGEDGKVIGYTDTLPLILAVEDGLAIVSDVARSRLFVTAWEWR